MNAQVTEAKLKIKQNVDFRIINIGDNISTSMCCVTEISI